MYGTNMDNVNTSSRLIDTMITLDMVTKSQQQPPKFDWSVDLIDSIWYHISRYLTINDIHRLTRTCSSLYTIFASHDFWSYLIRRRFGHAIWHRSIKNSLLLPDDQKIVDLSRRKPCRSKSIYFELLKRKRISFADFNNFTFDTNRNYTTIVESSSLNGYVLYIKDTIETCYSLHIETMFENILPGNYDVIWRMKLNTPYMFGETEFFASAEQVNPGKTAYMRWTQDDFLSMYSCFYCDIAKTNLWFYQTIGTVEINGNKPCNVFISMTNHDSIHAKHGVYLDYVELKLRLE
ncbi:unnamed protein product [Rotaria magnacalcarata]|uniref:F-box domain-containing protein n=4 Tax=Rotaria TaxID=231623 RepID=A0A816QFS6_9BILA|nr:unnamed protein product [Rotaria magnacalcarata]CAF2059089.1 unnamed protein product [Rotaria magnacalcarata]